ncbi:hypothetical protein FHT44_006680 [Mycolicibacterium sp. BK634]|uniref:hypothetical protein n=1 Tax=Mycolicibacterium sp. BK634 TaxID=2587099 RepID=UPI00161D3E38|nr:hypothetical protein [Mycolicibacterium sp. BK634]
MTLTVSDIERWNAGDVREVFHAASTRAQANFDAADGLATLPAFESWGGEAAEAAAQAIGQTRRDLDANGNEALAVASGARSAADNIERVKSELATLKADADALGMEIDPLSDTVVPGPEVRNPIEAELKQAQLQPRLDKIVAEANVVDIALATAINMAGGKTPIPVSDPTTTPGTDQRGNQSAAFRAVYGHDPVTANDWQMAAALDPRTYDPRDGRTPAEVRVVKIRPVPGQGLVRVSQWIEQRDVSNLPPSRDFGNNRPADPHFDPSNSKVTTYIDYERGLVVMRQNPSIEQTDGGGVGQVKVQAPSGSVTQTPDGAVRIQYSAGNPFAPPIAQAPPAPLADHQWTVNGDLVFTPGADGVHVDGTRGDYPSLEVYQDLPDGTMRTVLIDPAESGRSWGPFANLPFHHDIGIGGRAFAPFETGGWNPKYDVHVPLPSTDFGMPASPPSVPPMPPSTAIPS